jgi:UDP-N-acetylmuramoyl-L-alanyl-D-glutamate--2,6-diaminopimelate ligase
MKLVELLSDLKTTAIAGDLDTEILGLAYDSRQVAPGFMFVAICGLRADGNRFVPEAIDRGAVAVVSSQRRPATSAAAAWVQVDDERVALAALAGNLYGHPTHKLHLVGVTGTNGKTTTCYLIESVLRNAGRPASLFGTIEYRGPGFVFPAERTTPEAPDLEKLFQNVVRGGWSDAVMEVSSHAIEMKRVAALRFDVAIFTNLTRDHLDFHGDMESYFRAKKKLFLGVDGQIPRVMVLNMDDPRFEELRSIEPSRVLTYGMQPAAEISPIHYHVDWQGADVTYKTPSGDLHVRTSLMGKPNLYNIGAAIGAGIALDVPNTAIARGIGELPNVPGRFELVNAGQPFRVIVDYAHTDDALEKVLKSAREITSGKLIVVFGCGGERDTTKRRPMGEVAVRESDYAIVTSDNPRTEDPMSIIREIEKGMNGVLHAVIADRKEAIRNAIRAAQAGDTVVIAGKGHEAYQIIGKTSYPFDDRVVARELLYELVSGRN